MFNPTNCGAQQIIGTIGAVVAPAASVASPFAATGCKNLPFRPSFRVSTQAGTSKASGASLLFKIASGPGQANIGQVHLTFPKQLPARLTTLQKACTESQFNTNPAGCPAGSVIGTAVARTPVLSSPLTGPIYLVSHGGAAFPDAVVVLQGEGVLLDLVGNTNIRKGITTSTFSSVPDAPINTFEAVLPEGPHSAFATNISARARGNMCGQSLTMPNVLTAQNGAVIVQSTKIGVTGCPKAKRKVLTRAQKLAVALKGCRKKAMGHKRTSCEKQARRRFGPVKARKKGK
jgi:type IV secretory pathway protease TraF